MFGLTFEKLFLVAIVAGVVIGPQRLPLYAARLAEWLRSMRTLLETSRRQAEVEIGLTRSDWEALDPRRYDPRRVVREALDPSPAPPVDPVILEEAARVRPGQQYLLTGSAAHPRRIRLDSLPVDDPRRLAAQVAAQAPPEPALHESQGEQR